MAKIAFILLCHKDPDAVIAQARQLTDAGDMVAIHYDRRAPADEFEAIRAALGDNPSVTFARRRVRCGWGEWSLVQATLNAVEAALDTFPRATHLYMLSGDCMPIKTAEHIHARLDADDADLIEAVGFFDGNWIKAGLTEERLTYRHFVNERKHKALFYGMLALQRRLGLSRAIPADLTMMIGSQWWCLRRRTVEAILDFIGTRRDVVRFFRTTWIPDETFFQTLVCHLVPTHEIRSRTPTFLMFTDYGMPVVFHDDHHDLLLQQDFFFARKIGSHARGLMDRLGRLYAQTGVEFPGGGDGHALFQYLTRRGRVGGRHGPRIWDRRDLDEVLLVVCKKWHIARRLLDRMPERPGEHRLAYVFNETDTELPDMGGLECGSDKRRHNRVAFLGALAVSTGARQMMVCLDPADRDLISELAEYGLRVRVLHIRCEFSDDYLAGHAGRVGLVAEHATPEAANSLVVAIRGEFADEDTGLAATPNLHTIDQSASATRNAGPLAGFLDITVEEAHQILSDPHLFFD